MQGKTQSPLAGIILTHFRWNDKLINLYKMQKQL